MRLSLPLLSLSLLLCSFAGHAQSPPGINYQGVARNLDGKPLSLKEITIKINIVRDGENGPVEYAETHSLKTNSFGLFTLVIGTGSVVTGDFAFISWAMGNKWLRVEMDPDGGSRFQIMGSQQFMSVPYAFYSKYSGNNVLMPGQGIQITNNVVSNTGDADNNPANELNTSVVLGADNKLRITDGGGTKEADLSSLAVMQSLEGVLTRGNDAGAKKIANLAEPTDASDAATKAYVDSKITAPGDPSSTNEIQDLSSSSSGTSRTINISGGGAPATFDVGDNDNNASNELQNLSLASNVLSLSNSAPTINLAPYLDNTDSQALSLSSNILSLSNSAPTINLAPYLDNTDAQALSLSSNILSLSNSAPTINLAPYLDNTDAQNLTWSSSGINRTINISGGTGVTFDVADNDNSATNELQNLSVAANVVSLSNSATTINLAPYLDNTDNQNLSLNANILSLTGDATPVDLSTYLDDTDDQALSLSGTNLSLVGGGSVNLAGFMDNTDNQDLTLVGNSLSLTGDSSPVNLAGYLDNTDNQNVTVTAPTATTRTISISGGAGDTFSIADGDSDATNEIQTLAFNPTTRNLSITMGSPVNIPETQNIAQVLAQSNDAGGQRITNIGAPTANTDAVTKQYVDNADAAINSRLSNNYVFKASFTFSTLLTGGSNIPMPLTDVFDDFNIVNASNFTAAAAGTYVFTVDGDISSLLVGSALSILYNGTKHPVSVGSNNRYNTTLMFRLTAGQTVSLVADGLGISTNINGTFFGYKLP